MKRVNCLASFAILGIVLIGTGCMDRPPAPVCPAPTELSQTESLIINFQGLDMLLVVDNSGSMEDEQRIFATAIYNLVTTLTNNPDPDWKFPDASDVRIGVITTDIGLQYGVNGELPGDEVSVPGCNSDGDNGQLQTNSVLPVDLEVGGIACALPGGAAPHLSTQCPLFTETDTSAHWLCQDPDSDGSAHCYPPGASNTVPCAAGSIWAETPTADLDTDGLPIPNYELPLDVACMTKLGIDGCGIEQQLQASKVSLDFYGEQDNSFVRDEALLAIIIVSDEEDCSIRLASLFETDEFDDLGLKKLNVACQIHEDLLFAPKQYKTWWAEQKGGVSAAVVFAAIVGVPPGNTCEGFGPDISRCLDDDDMQFEQVTNPGGQWVAKPACDRDEVIVNDTDSSTDLISVTSATPGRRYVELAEEMGTSGYIYSICNADWSPAVENIAELIAKNLSSSCYPKPLEWDPENQEATCDVVIVNTVSGTVSDTDDFSEICGFALEDGVIPVTEEIGQGDEINTQVFCPLPKIGQPIDCEDIDDDALASQFGWYYCEDFREDFSESCQDALDNDDDGLFDCDDDSCSNCPVCGGKECDNISCRYAVRLTKKTRDDVNVKNRPMAVQCLQQFNFTDSNCQENTDAVCWDNEDNDGNGGKDCDGAPAEGEDEVDWRFAEISCCPIVEATEILNEDGSVKEIHCVLTDDDNTPVFEETCNGNSRPSDVSAYTLDNLPPACRAAAAARGCQLTD